MRRVVADQIKALNELSASVSRSNRAVDAAPAAVQPRRVNEPLRRPSRRSFGRRRRRLSLAQAPEPPAPAPAPRRVEPAPEPAPRPAPRGARPRRRSRATIAEQGGWLSNLLTRASQDDAAAGRKPRRVGTPSGNGLSALDSISGDIARMIDHDAAVELWDRYGRGERNVFTRRLYTLQGQQTFDEIRRKYRRDAEFKQTVDRYVEEFERLIAEVGRRRPRPDARQDLSHLGDRQGLHHAGPCERALRIAGGVWRNGAARGFALSHGPGDAQRPGAHPAHDVEQDFRERGVEAVRGMRGIDLGRPARAPRRPARGDAAGAVMHEPRRDLDEGLGRPASRSGRRGFRSSACSPG